MRSAVGGETSTLATGTAVTVTSAVPVLPSLVAVIVAAPMATAVMRPAEETVATLVLFDENVIGRPESTLPWSSVTWAVSCFVDPTSTLTCVGERITAPTGLGFTVSADVPVFPSDAAVIVTAPGDTPVTSPVDVTVALRASLDDHVIARPVSVPPCASLAVAVSCSV